VVGHIVNLKDSPRVGQPVLGKWEWFTEMKEQKTVQCRWVLGNETKPLFARRGAVWRVFSFINIVSVAEIKVFQTAHEW